MTKKATRAEIGQRLLAARLQRGLAQADVARRAGLAPSYLSRVENGRIQPTFRTVQQIAAALGASMHELSDSPAGEEHPRGPCPVTARGRCLLDLIAAEADEEHYSPREIRLLRSFASWLKSCTPERLRAMEVLLEDLTRGVGSEGRG